MSRTKIFYIFYFFFAVLLCFSTAEIGIRLLGWWNGINYGLYIKDLTASNRNHGLRMGTGKFKNVVLLPDSENLVTTSDFTVIYKTNSMGMRDKEYPLLPPAGYQRFIALGDSFTFGEGIPYGKRFTDIAEENLPNTEILNMGVPGYGVDQELLQFVEFGLPLKPAHVLLFINKVDTMRRNADIFKNGKIVLDEPVSTLKNIYLKADSKILEAPPSFFLRSQFLSFAIYNFKIWQYKNEFQETDLKVWKRLAAEIDENASPATETNTYLINRTKAIIEKIKEICEKNKIKFTVINIDPEFNLSYLNEIPNLDYIDLSGELAKAANKFPIRFTYDQHFNKRTNALLGDLLTKILTTKTSISSTGN